MRYLDGAPPNSDIPYGQSMHDMLSLSMYLAIVIGLCLYVAGRHGKVLWLKTWSLGLIICSVLYLANDWFDLF